MTKNDDDLPPAVNRSMVIAIRDDVDILQKRFRTLLEEWQEVHGKFQVLNGRIVRLRQEVEGTHKGGRNSKGRNQEDEDIGTLEEQRIAVERRMKRGA